MLIFYSEAEGGLWRPLETERSKDEIVAQLRLYWRPMRPFPSSRIVNGTDGIDVHAVLFPDSDVWDSHFGGIREPGRPGYYEEVRELIKC